MYNLGRDRIEQMDAEPQDPRWVPKTPEQVCAYLVEEIGECIAALGKCERWGYDSYNPDLHPDDQEPNRDWLLRELRDLKRAIDYTGFACGMVSDNSPSTATVMQFKAQCGAVLYGIAHATVLEDSMELREHLSLLFVFAEKMQRMLVGI